MKEVKPLATEALDLLEKASSVLLSIREHFEEKAGAAEDRGREDHAERWEERTERMDEAETSVGEAVEALREVFGL